METLLDLLDNTDKRVLFITGAGISVNSGIPPYRGSSDAVWSNFVQDFATRNLDVFIINNINWIDDENYHIDGQNIELTCTNELFQFTLENDYQMLIE